MSCRELGETVRHPRRRLGPAVPAPRERDRAERGRQREAVRELLDARGVPQHGRREDVEVARQLLHRARGPREARSRCRAASSCASSCCAATTAARSNYTLGPARGRRQHAARLLHDAARGAAARRCAVDWAHPLAQRFRDAMNDDFDTPIAFAVLHELRGEVNRTRSPALAGLLKALGGTIGFLQADPEAFLKGGVRPAAATSTSRRSSPSAPRRRRRRTSRAPTRSASSSTRPASSSRTSPAASRSGARNEKGPRSRGPFAFGRARGSAHELLVPRDDREVDELRPVVVVRAVGHLEAARRRRGRATPSP